VGSPLHFWVHRLPGHRLASLLFTDQNQGCIFRRRHQQFTSRSVSRPARIPAHSPFLPKLTSTVPMFPEPWRNGLLGFTAGVARIAKTAPKMSLPSIQGRRKRKENLNLILVAADIRRLICFFRECGQSLPRRRSTLRYSNFAVLGLMNWSACRGIGPRAFSSGPFHSFAGPGSQRVPAIQFPRAPDNQNCMSLFHTVVHASSTPCDDRWNSDRGVGGVKPAKSFSGRYDACVVSQQHSLVTGDS